MSFCGRHDIRHNDTPHNDTQHNHPHNNSKKLKITLGLVSCLQSVAFEPIIVSVVRLNAIIPSVVAPFCDPLLVSLSSNLPSKRDEASTSLTILKSRYFLQKFLYVTGKCL